MIRRSIRRAASLLTLYSVAVLASAQPAVGVMDRPCDALTPLPQVVADYMAKAAQAKAEGRTLPPPAPERLAEGMALYSDWQKARLIEDFAGRCRYEQENQALVPATEDRVVLFGDSITELWVREMPDLFDAQFLGRGISGQTTSQMLVRFRQDVVDLDPAVVQIMAGTNDIAGNTGPVRLAWIQQNIAGMAETARAHGSRVLLASVLPARAFDWRPGIDPRAAIAELNAWLGRYAAAQCLTYVDYHAVLVDAEGGLRRDYSDDGVHPNAAGYAAMRPLLEQALAAPSPRCAR